MLDRYGRAIDYLRVSVTERCNLHCRYCRPQRQATSSPGAPLPFTDLLRICRVAAGLGITRFKVTGGEPLARAGCVDFIARLKKLPGVEQVTLTTNGLLLDNVLADLCDAGLDGVNLSLDTLDDTRYRALTGYGGAAVEKLQSVLRRCAAAGLRVKVNTVLLPENLAETPQIAALAAQMPVDVRFIELMPIGAGAGMQRVLGADAMALLQRVWPDLHPTAEKRGNGPAHYYASRALLGRIGLIDAVSHAFCAECNRLRLTSAGLLKPCLCYDTAVDLRALLLRGAGDEALASALRGAILSKPRAHCFAEQGGVTEHRWMSQIGG